MSASIAPRVLRILTFSAIGAVVLRFTLLLFTDFDLFDVSTPSRRLFAGIAGAVILFSLSQVLDPEVAFEAGGGLRSDIGVKELQDKVTANEAELRR